MRKDEVRCYNFIYCLTAIRYYVQTTALAVSQHPLFEAISLLAIIANCVILVIDDPTNSVQAPWQSDVDYVFQALYTAELVVKVMGMGFLFNVGAYMRDPWNIFDFIIIVFGYLSLLNLGGGFDLKALRTFRVLRPLRTISSIEGLRILMNALISSLLPLLDTIIVLMFFALIFGIAGIQLWHGVLKMRCFNIDTGDIDSRVCGSSTCPNNMKCVTSFGNPNYGATNFDDIFAALLTVFQCITMEGWTDTQLNTMRAYGEFSAIYFTLLVLIGSFFLVNFTLAVIKSQVSKSYSEAAANRGKKALTAKSVRNEEATKSIGYILHQGKDKVDIINPDLFGNFGVQQEQLERSCDHDDEMNYYQKKLGFDEFDELTENQPPKPNNKKVIDKLALKNVIHVIEEVDESLPNINNDILQNGNTKSKKLSPNQERHIKISDVPSRKVPFHGSRLDLAGNLGSKKPVAPAIKAAFAAFPQVDSLDDFTNEFFSHQEPWQTLAQANEKANMAKSKPYGRMDSSSLIDMEDSGTQLKVKDEVDSGLIRPEEKYSEINHFSDIGSPINSPGRNMNDDAEHPLLSFKINPNADMQEFDTIKPAETHDSMKNGKPLEKRQSTFKENTGGDTKRHSVKTDKELEDENRRKEEEKKKKEEEEEEKQKQKIMNEKFIFRDKKINIPSAGDVLASTQEDSEIAIMIDRSQPVVVTYAKSPYKVKLLYVPTELPKEDDGDDSKTGKNGTQSRRDNLSINDGRSSIGKLDGSQHGSIGKRSVRTNRTKRSNKSARTTRSKKRATDTKSKLNATQIKGKKGESVLASSLGNDPESKNNDTKSNADSAPGSTKKDGDDDKAESKKVEIPVIDQLRKDYNDEMNGVKRQLKWNGQDILLRDEPYLAVYHTKYVSSARIWEYGLTGKVLKTRFFLRGIATSVVLENCMNLLVLINTVLLALDRYNQPVEETDILNSVNIAITAIFIAELVLKMSGMGLVKYFSDSMNYLDFAVVLFSLVEIIFLNGKGALAAFRTLRIFRVIRLIRTFRVLRIARLLRSLRSMQTIIEVIGKTIGSFAYIGLLLIIFILIYALFGMQLYGGRFYFPSGTPRQNFDSFHHAFLSIFQVLTMENWQELLYSSMRAQHAALSSLYLISWIFIGNYVLLNLFLAIMLDAFSEVDEELTKETGDNGVTVYSNHRKMKMMRKRSSLRRVRPSVLVLVLVEQARLVEAILSHNVN